MSTSIKSPADADLEAQRLLRGGDLEAAGKLLDGAREAFPEDPSLHLRHGLLELRRGESEAAVQSIERAVSLAPKASAYRVFLGAALYDSGRIEDASAAFTEARRTDPDYVAAEAWKGLLQLASGDLEAGLQTVRRYRPLADSRLLGSRLLALLENHVFQNGSQGIELGDEKDAPGYPTKLDEYYDRSEKWLGLKLGPAARALGDAAFGLTALQKPFSPSGYKLRRLMHESRRAYQLDDKQAAKKLARERLDSGPFQPDVFLWTLWVTYEAGDYDACTELTDYLEKELKEPACEHPEPAEVLARVLYRKGEYEQAMECLKEHCESRVTDHGPRYVKGLCLLRLGQRAEALHWFAEALDMPNPRILDARMRDAEQLRSKPAADDAPGDETASAQ